MLVTQSGCYDAVIISEPARWSLDSLSSHEYPGDVAVGDDVNIQVTGRVQKLVAGARLGHTWRLGIHEKRT